MDLIFKGDVGVAVNPIYIYIISFDEDCKKYYHIRAAFNDGSNWIRLTKNYDSYDSVVDAYKTMYQEAIDLSFNYKQAQEVEPIRVIVCDKRSENLDLVKSKEPIKVEVISSEIRDLEEEK